MTGADIIFFAIVAVYFAMKIYSVLGRKNDDSDYFKESESRVVLPEEFLKEKISKNNEEADQKLSSASMQKLREDEVEEFNFATDQSKDSILSIIKADRNFSLKEFSEGAKGAFDMILKAFSEKDRDTLKMLLSDKLYKDLDNKISSNEDGDLEEVKSLISINILEISSASLEKNVAKISVKFETEQIEFTKDSKGEIIDGDPNHIDTIEDEWSFERSIKSSNPNWKITAL